MRLDEVLPELMGSLALSELFFRGEGPPRACRRMDQYQRKMKKPMGSEGAQGSAGAGGGEGGPAPSPPPYTGYQHPCGLGGTPPCTRHCAIAWAPSH